MDEIKKSFHFYHYKRLNNIDEIDEINEINEIDKIKLLKHYQSIGQKNGYLISINNFYNLYPKFNILFYKKINKDIHYENNIDYMYHYHYIGVKENRFYSIENFKDTYSKLYNTDINFIFLKNFYDKFNNKEQFDIIISLINDSDIFKYIYSENDFFNKYPDFDIEIYKLFNKDRYFINDIKYKSYWYHVDQYNQAISSVNDFINYNNLSFNLKLYKYLYNINNFGKSELIFFYQNSETLIYSIDLLYKYADDFNYLLFIENYPEVANLNNIDTLAFYIQKLDTINKIYSEKIFYLKYPKFNIKEYKKFNKNHRKNVILDYYLKNDSDKEKIIVSIVDFYEKTKDFNLNFYKRILLKDNIVFDKDEDYIYHWYEKNISISFVIDDNTFYTKYPKFNINIYKVFNKDIIELFDDKYILYDFYYNTESYKIIYSIETFYNFYKDFDLEIYQLLNNLEDIDEENTIIHFHDVGLPSKLIYNLSMIDKNEFSLEIYRSLNKDLKLLNDNDLIIHWYKKGKYQNRIYSIKTFSEIYPDMSFYKEDEIIDWMNKERTKVTNIYEVLIDLDNVSPKEKLKPGISLIIRAKNEEYNIKYCIESVVDLVEEIIFVDNNSTDNTYNLVKDYCNKYSNIKLYQYNISVAKAGIEHTKAIKDDNKNTLGTFYNWCLSKATRYNVFKWDADFICIRNNFINLVDIYNLRKRDDNFSIWFTGKTLFENNHEYYLNYNSFYDEFRIFSYKNGFKWYDGDTCEYTEPYLQNVLPNKKYRYLYPLFYELKRTSIDEFKERSSLIDSRDINDFNILNRLKNNNYMNLIYIKNELIDSSYNIILYTTSLSFGGGNQFIINIYKIYKSIGMNVIVIPLREESVGKNKYNIILKEDIIEFKNFNLEFIEKYKPHFILLNSDIPFKEEDIAHISKITKLIFVTHSDVAYSNTFIEKYHNYFSNIVTVNNYTITKLRDKLNIDSSKFLKLINYSDLNRDMNKTIKRNKIKKFGIISRFSEDKNIPMLILSLKDVFKKYNDYKCILVGTNNIQYDNYLKHICIINNLENNILFEGYQNDVTKYYNDLDFIVLPSVSEGCSYNIIEAMSLGLPVVTSDVGGNHELINNRENGILYQYTGIKEFEKDVIFITNYNEQLLRLGYFINNSDFKKRYDIIHNFKDTEVIVPYFVIPKNKLDYGEINKKIKLFSQNLNNITKSIIEMIEMNDAELEKIRENNIRFIHLNFNETDYIKQIISII
jgi:glycosyltransferase involved in cell wall biosynthesis